MNKLRKEIVSSAIGDKPAGHTSLVTRRYRFGTDFIGFRGHFPGYPILPAFVQILTAVTLIEEHDKCRLQLETVEKAKFHIPIHPDIEIEVSCALQRARGKRVCDAHLTVAEGLASSFRLSFAEERGPRC